MPEPSMPSVTHGEPHFRGGHRRRQPAETERSDHDRAHASLPIDTCSGGPRALSARRRGRRRRSRARRRARQALPWIATASNFDEQRHADEADADADQPRPRDALGDIDARGEDDGEDRRGAWITAVRPESRCVSAKPSSQNGTALLSAPSTRIGQRWPRAARGHRGREARQQQRAGSGRQR